MAKNKTPQCSFCGKSKDDVSQLIAAEDANICNECIELCTDLIAEGDDHTALEDDDIDTSWVNKNCQPQKSYGRI